MSESNTHNYRKIREEFTRHFGKAVDRPVAQAFLEGLRLHDEIDVQAAQIEELRMKLRACSVAALCNTAESAADQRIKNDNPYWSAAYGDVVDAVAREMLLRERVKELTGGKQTPTTTKPSTIPDFPVAIKL